MVLDSFAWNVQSVGSAKLLLLGQNIQESLCVFVRVRACVGARLEVEVNKLIGKQPQLFITLMKQNANCEASTPPEGKKKSKPLPQELR